MHVINKCNLFPAQYFYLYPCCLLLICSVFGFTLLHGKSYSLELCSQVEVGLLGISLPIRQGEWLHTESPVALAVHLPLSP